MFAGNVRRTTILSASLATFFFINGNRSLRLRTMPLLRSLDVFSGIGGMTHALSGVAKPVAYCENAPHALRILEANIARGHLPRAPICADVRDLTPNWLRANAIASPQLIVAGFPCIGFSTAGKRQGFKHEQTNLFYELLRVIDDVARQARSPPIVFLENVANIVHARGIDIVIAELGRRRLFELRWYTVRASSVGAPQLRPRWYCLAMPLPHTMPRPPRGVARVALYDWANVKPTRLVVLSDRDAIQERVRVRLLGNSVIPCVVAFVLRLLWAADSDVRAKTVPVNGIWCDGEFFELPPVPNSPRDYAVHLDPRVHREPTAPPSHLVRKRTTGILTHPVRRKLWGTLTVAGQSPSHVLTTRGQHRVSDQLRFEVSTPTTTRHGVMSAAFAEWLMGFPLGWTDGR